MLQQLSSANLGVCSEKPTHESFPMLVSRVKVIWHLLALLMFLIFFRMHILGVNLAPRRSAHWPTDKSSYSKWTNRGKNIYNDNALLKRARRHLCSNLAISLSDISLSLVLKSIARVRRSDCDNATPECEFTKNKSSARHILRAPYKGPTRDVTKEPKKSLKWLTNC